MSDTELTVTDAAEAFKSSWGTLDALDDDNTDTTENSPEDTEVPEGDDEAPENEGASDTEESAEDGSKEPVVPEEEDPDALEIEVAEGTKVTLKDLKERFLQAQEVEATKAAVEAQKAKIEADGSKYTAGLEKMFKAAEARYAPYAQTDDLVLMKELSAEAFAQYRKDKQEAFTEYQFLANELDNTIKDFQTKQQETYVAQAQEAIKVLSGPDGIPGWSPELYNDISGYAVKSGMKPEIVKGIVDPVAIKMLHKAMLYDKAQEAVKNIKPVVRTPAKVLKTTSTPSGDAVTKSSATEALNRLRKTGKVDDAAAAFKATWANRE